MKKIIKFTTAAVILAFGLFSCAKPGCTDSRATNYSVDAKDDDGTCNYRGDITFWCLPATSENLITDGHDTLRFELEGEIVDSIATEVFFSPTGECSTPGVKTIARDSLPYEYRHYKYRVFGEDFVELFEGFITLDANDCYALKIEY